VKVDQKKHEDHVVNKHGAAAALKLDFHSTIESFQVTVGCFMIVLSIVQILNTYFRFHELSSSDREQFAGCQVKARRDFREKILQESIQNYTLISTNDLDILKCQKPNSKDLMLALFQKFIFDMLLGIWLATAGFNLFTVYDFITFGETLENINNSKDGVLKAKFKATQFSFVLQGDAKLSMVVFTACILSIFVSYFATVTIYQGMLSKERVFKLRNEHLINLSFFFGFVGFLLMLNSEDYREEEIQKQRILLVPLVIGQIFMSFALGLGHISTLKQLKRILGSDELLYTYNCHSPANSDSRSRDDQMGT